MAEDDEFDESGSNDPTPHDLRKMLADEKKERKALQTQLDERNAQDRERSVTELVKSKGLPDKIAKLVPRDVADDPAKVETWLADYADVFGATQGTTVDAPPDNTDAETMAAQQRLADVTAGAAPSGKVADLEERLKGAKTQAELDEIWASRRL